MGRGRWIGTNLNYSYLSYYVHGAALGLALDLANREHTGGAALPRRFHACHVGAPRARPAGSPVGTVAAPYTIDDVRARLADVAGDGAVRRVISRALRAGTRGARTSPACSHPPGFACGKLLPGRASIGPVPLERRGSRLRVAAPVAPGTPLYEAGVAEDDEILSVAGHELTGPDVLAREIQQRAPGDRLALRVLPRGASAPRTVDVTLVEDARVEIVAVESLAEALTPERTPVPRVMALHACVAVVQPLRFCVSASDCRV